MTIQLTEEQRIKLLNSDDVYRVMQEILLREEKIDQEKEHFWMIGLGLNSRILYIEMVSMGSVKTTTVEPMNVFRVAVLKGAMNVILVHNHPSGELKPSDSDKETTDRLIQVGQILNIKVIDHMIISTNSYLSFLDIGLLETLGKSTKWIPQFELVERIKLEEKKIRDEAIRIEKEKGKIEKEKALKRGKQEKAIEIAKNCLQLGFTIKNIAHLTGLTKEEVEKIQIE